MESSQGNNCDEDLSDEESQYGYENEEGFDIDFEHTANRLTYAELATLLSNEPIADDSTLEAMDAAHAIGYLADNRKDLISVPGETNDDHKIIIKKTLNTNHDEGTGVFITVGDTANGLREKIAKAYGLNEEQRRVLPIVTDQALGESKIGN